jgi:hypothetical protein
LVERDGVDAGATLLLLEGVVAREIGSGRVDANGLVLTDRVGSREVGRRGVGEQEEAGAVADLVTAAGWIEVHASRGVAALPVGLRALDHVHGLGHRVIVKADRAVRHRVPEDSDVFGLGSARQDQLQDVGAEVEPLVSVGVRLYVGQIELRHERDDGFGFGDGIIFGRTTGRQGNECAQHAEKDRGTRKSSHLEAKLGVAHVSRA